MARVTRLAPAKVNLHLEVLGRRDDGYHELSTVMQTIDLTDEVTVTVRRDVAAGAPRVTLACDPAVTGAPEENLAYRAAAALVPDDAPFAVEVALIKRIPAGGGLGGGSSDAAAVLVAVDEVAELGLGRDRLAEIAVGLGADVPFFVHAASAGGVGTALCEGIGDRITPLPDVPALRIALAVPAFGCSTPAVYRALRLNLTQPRVLGTVFVQRISGSDAWSERPFNRLADAAFEVEPRLAEVRRWLDRVTGLRFQVSGSGSTLFAIVPAGTPVDAPDLGAAPAALDRWIVTESARG